MDGISSTKIAPFALHMGPNYFAITERGLPFLRVPEANTSLNAIVKIWTALNEYAIQHSHEMEASNDTTVGQLVDAAYGTGGIGLPY